jgi:DNA-binding NtrC family response regulator
MASIIIIDDDIGIRDLLKESLESGGHETIGFSSAEEALQHLDKYDPELILLDLNLPGMHGFEFLEKAQNWNLNVPVVVVTSNSDVASAVKAMKLGAFDYICKPFNLEELSFIIQKVIDSRIKDDHIAYLRRKSQYSDFERIVGDSAPMREVYRFIDQVASTDKTTVLIRGETGTGKELVAKAIHYQSNRANKPFIDINCSAFNENLLEAELFGYESGAFTDAKHRKKGLLELAHQGTFFLDEIGDMAIGLQAKILKVIEKQTFRRLGGTQEIKVDTRIISATSRDLEEGIKKKTFREDLYYRLNVATITLPPLRDRRNDVLALADFFLNMYNREFKKNIKGFSAEVRAILSKYTWPGNVRELRNAIEKAVLFETHDQITTVNFKIVGLDNGKNIHFLTSPANFILPLDGISLKEIEKALIENALISTRGNQSKAAKLLKISRETFKYRMRKYNVRYGQSQM